MKQTTLNWSSPRKAAEPPGDSAAGSPQLQIRRSFSQIWSDEEKLEVDEEILEETLTAGLEQKRKWEPVWDLQAKLWRTPFKREVGSGVDGEL